MPFESCLIWLSYVSVVLCSGVGAPGLTPLIDPAQQALVNNVMSRWGLSAGCPNTVLHRCGAVAAVVSEDSYYGVQVIAGQENTQYYPVSGYDGSPILYEIQSITKVFTALICVLLVEKGMVQYSTTLGDLFKPLSMLRLVDDSVRNVTLHELLTHHSGLPVMPLNLSSGQGTSNKFHGYTRTNLLDDLSRVVLKPKRFLYSNFAFGILGYLEEVITGKTFLELVTELICEPLGLQNTTIAAGHFTTEQWRQNVIPGLSPDHGRVAWRNASYGILKANGALVSSVQDMVKFTRATLTAIDACTASKNTCSPLQRSLTIVAGVHNEIEDSSGLESIGYTWQHTFDHSQQFTTWKTGDGEGYSIFVGFERAAGKAVIAFDSCAGCQVWNPAHDTSWKPVQSAALQILSALSGVKPIYLNSSSGARLPANNVTII